MKIAAVAALVLATVWLLSLGLLYAAGYRPLVVHSASMAPAVDSGDLVITRAVAPTAVGVGDVVSFHDRSRENRLITHRVTDVRRQDRRVAFVTRGDVNSGLERWSSPADARIGTLALRIPLAGYAVTWLTRPAIILALLALVLVLFVRRAIAARASRRRAIGSVVRAALAGLTSAAAIVIAPILLGVTEGAYAAVTTSEGNQLRAAATFCTTPTQVLTASADTTLKEANPATNYGDSVELDIVSQSANRNSRALVRFSLGAPPVDPNCSLKSAVLRVNVLWGWISTLNRTLHARVVTDTWVESTEVWTGQVPSSPNDIVPATSDATTVAFDVKDQLKNQYSDAKTNGFLLRDANESAGIAASQAYTSREWYEARPTLTVEYQ